MRLRKVLVLIATLLCGFVLGLSVGDNVQASSIHYNEAPKVLKGEWSTKYLKVNDSSNSKVHYCYTRLFVTNRDFHLEGYDTEIVAYMVLLPDSIIS